MSEIKKNIETFENLLMTVKRDGINELLDFIRKSDFYSAPASTKYHLSEEGGLLQHSLDVYYCIKDKLKNPMWNKVLCETSMDSIILVSLLHDVCKTYYYTKSTKNQKTYDPQKVALAKANQIKKDSQGEYIWETVPCYAYDNKYPLGHGSKSVIFIMKYITLSMEETAAILWHMGSYCDSSQWNELGQAYEKYPLALALHQADMEATHLIEIENSRLK